MFNKWVTWWRNFEDERPSQLGDLHELEIGVTDEFIQGRMDFMNLIIATIRAVGQDDLPSWAVDRVND